MLTIYKKFEDTLKSCELLGPLSIQFKAIGWLLYIMARVILLKGRNEIVESACLLIAMVYFLIINAPQGICFNKISGADNSEIKKKLCEIFKLRKQDAFDAMDVSFQKIVQQLVATGFLKLSKEGKFSSIFEESNIELNAMRLKSAYEQYAVNFDIDERLFISCDTVLASPCKLTPFARQGVVNVIVTPRKRQSILESDSKSKNETSPKGRCKITLNTRLQEIQLTKHTLRGSYSTLPNILVSTPMTRAMEMNNWLQEHISNYHKLEGFSPVLKRLLENNPKASGNLKSLLQDCIEKVEKEICGEEKTGDPKLDQIKSFYFCVVDELLLAEEKINKSIDLNPLLQNENFHRSVFAAAAETILFIHNSTSLMFEDLLDKCNVSAFDFWKCLPYFLRFDISIPPPLSTHFNEINKKILASIAWKKKSPIYALIAQLMQKPLTTEDFPQGSLIKPSHEFFFKSVLEFAAALIVDISANMNLKDEALKEKMWEVMKHCLSVETDLMADRDLVQLVLCSIYGVCKMQQSQKSSTIEKYTFNAIIKCYMQINWQLADLYSSTFHVIKLDEKSFVNIIEFYNRAYLPRMKAALFKICIPENNPLEKTGLLPTNQQKIQILAPPHFLHESLPKGNKYTIRSGVAKTPSQFESPMDKKLNLTPILTPRTKALIASAENIIIPTQTSTFAQSFNSDRKKDFKGALKDKILEQTRTGCK